LPTAQKAKTLGGQGAPKLKRNYFPHRFSLAKRNRVIAGKQLVAETGADGDLVTALGAAAAQDGGARLGLHAGKEAVGLGPVAAVGLKGTLRHDKNLLRQERAPAQTFSDSSNL